MSDIKKIICFIFILQVLLAETVNAEVYKWTDENGKVVYGDRPGSDNADKFQIKDSPDPDQEYLERYQKQKKLLDVMQEERHEDLALKQKEKEEKAKQEAVCTKLVKELQEMKDARLLYEESDDPYNPRILSDEQRKNEEQKYEKYIKENC